MATVTEAMVMAMVTAMATVVMAMEIQMMKKMALTSIINTTIIRIRKNRKSQITKRSLKSNVRFFQV